MKMRNYDESFVEFDRSVLAALLAAVTPSPHKAASDILQHFPSFQHATRADPVSYTHLTLPTKA